MYMWFSFIDLQGNTLTLSPLSLWPSAYKVPHFWKPRETLHLDALLYGDDSCWKASWGLWNAVRFISTQCLFILPLFAHSVLITGPHHEFSFWFKWKIKSLLQMKGKYVRDGLSALNLVRWKEERETTSALDFCKCSQHTNFPHRGL